jgi:hypothetical protein
MIGGKDLSILHTPGKITIAYWIGSGFGPIASLDAVAKTKIPALARC